MTKAELIDILEEIDDEDEVRLMTQPSWPFEYAIRDGYVIDCDDPAEGDSDEFSPASPRSERILYLTEGKQLGYGTKEAWQ